MVLKEQLVLERTKADSLLAVRNLNLWGEGLTDVSIVEKIPGIEVLALAANHLTTLRPFASCTSLRELYLRKNDIQSLAEIKHIKDLPNLRTLWLMDNPCAKSPEYRGFVILCCQHLKQLDNIEVTEQEREEAKKRLSERTVLEMLNCGGTDGSDYGGRPQSPFVAAHRRNGAPGTAPQTQRAILTAILSLVPELSLESLSVLRNELSEEVGRREKVMRQNARGQ